ncbi:MAG: polyprenyl synthetase family protein [Mycobacteriales bacterium]
MSIEPRAVDSGPVPQPPSVLFSGEVVSILDRSAALTRPALRDAVARLAPSMQRVAGYHFGWLAADGSRSAAEGGKGLRPALATLSALAAGAPGKTGVPGGVAVELVHGFSLLHDDLMDGDEERHHRPTAWTVFGSAAAILGGVALLTRAEQILLDLHTPAGADAARMLTDATARLVTGQTDDLEFETRADVALDECVAMAGNKTAALFSCAAGIGAVLGEAPDSLVAALCDYGEHLGLAFQLVDDLLGIWGAPAVTGKPVLADLRAGKKSLPIVAALRSGAPEANRLASLLEHRGGDHHRSADDSRYVEMAALVQAGGGRDWARAQAECELASAHAALADAELPPAVRADLVTVADFVVRRQL